MVAMVGKMYGDAYTYGVMLGQMMLVWSVLLVAAMNIFLVARHTRKDEEEGRLEVLRALPIGRSAGLFSLTILLFAANIVTGILTALGLASFGIESIDLKGSLVYGAVLTASGIFFAALTMLIAQLASTARGTTSWAFVILGAAYLMRAAGDVQSASAANYSAAPAEPSNIVAAADVLRVASPLGVVEYTEVYVKNSIWPILVLLAASVVLLTVAFRLGASRDLGMGLIPPKDGLAHARKSLANEHGLTFRLLRNTMLAWVFTLFVFGAAYGSVFGDLTSFYEGNDLFKAMLGAGSGADPGTGSGAGQGAASPQDLIDPIIGTMMLIMAILGSIPVTAAVFRIHTEEKRGRIEQVYASPVSRTSNILGYILVAATLTIALMLATAVGMWIAASAVMEDQPHFAKTLGSAMNYVPAMLVCEGLAVLLVGLLPRFTSLVWLYLTYSFIATYLGELLKLPEFMKKLTPFGLTPKYPGEDFEPKYTILFLATAAALTAIGILAYRRRDLKSN
jgi:ABC-2 type transport system permease protein